MAKLLLLRHLKSQWNLENRFAGWTDGPLCQEDKGQAKEVAKKLFQIKIDVFYTSPLFRNQDTIARVLECTSKYPLFIHLDGGKMQKWGNFTDISPNDIPVYVSEKLNERYYGKLQGINRDEAMKKYGKEIVHQWRRSFNQAPPGGESLKDVVKRVVPFYEKYIKKHLKKRENVLVVGSHNSLRALVKYLENMSDTDIINLEIPVGTLIEYELDNRLKLKNKKIL